MSDIDVVSPGVDASVKPRGQATPVSPAMLEVIGDLAEPSKKVISIVGQALIAIIRGGVRFEQSRRSRLLECTPAKGWAAATTPYEFFLPEGRASRGISWWLYPNLLRAASAYNVCAKGAPLGCSLRCGRPLQAFFQPLGRDAHQ